jgi:hypothetical protein
LDYRTPKLKEPGLLTRVIGYAREHYELLALLVGIAQTSGSGSSVSILIDFKMFLSLDREKNKLLASIYLDNSDAGKKYGKSRGWWGESSCSVREGATLLRRPEP